MHSLLLVALIAISFHVERSEERSLQLLDYMTDSADNCTKLPAPILSDILGPAFNSRYMSIDKPPATDEEPLGGESNGKRGVATGLYPSFYVDDNHLLNLGDKPAWVVNHAADTNAVLTPRPKREVLRALISDMGRESRSSRIHRGRGQVEDATVRPWECEGKIRWMDLGTEYFPRFLRTVECAKSRCWYGHYQCLARSFTVKILRRKPGECVPGTDLKNTGVEGLPGELRELWIWEERAVNFCCDCTAP